jgi:hypothetical protein
MTEETMLVSLRAETLRANLSRLQEHLKSDPERFGDLKGLEDSINIGRRHVSALRHSQLDLEDGIKPQKEVFRTMNQQLDLAMDTIDAQLDTIEWMKKACFRVRTTPVGEDIQQALNTCTAPLVTELGALDRESADLSESWKDLRESHDPKAQQIFTDYVELLGGAALRDTGFDEGIGTLADKLLSGGGRLLALPTRRQALVKTFERIIRVNFPDWTIWTLPSVALEFWNVVGCQNLNSTVEAGLRTLSSAEQTSIREEHKACLGDAYATYTMGPAYAYYAVGLLLDPGSDQGHYRARAIVAMLETMDRNESLAAPPYIEVRRRLLAAWNAARKQLGQPPVALDANGSAEVADPDADGTGIRTLVRSFWNTLHMTTSGPFGVAMWNQIRGWVQLLLADKAADIVVSDGEGVELRHLLNAAWQARVDPERDPARDLNAAVKTLQDKFKKRDQRKGK